MVSLVLTIIAFAGAMGVPAFLTAIVESVFKVRPSLSRTRMNWPAEIAIKQTSVGQSLKDGLIVNRAHTPKAIRNLNRQSSGERIRPQPSRYAAVQRRHGTTRARSAGIRNGRTLNHSCTNNLALEEMTVPDTMF